MSIARYYNPKFRAIILARGVLPDWLLRHPRIDYIVSAIVSFPPWTDREVIAAMRREAQFFTLLTGELWVLDHVIPINHPDVCGLSVPWNLRIVPHRVNAAKGNRWFPNQLPLWSEEVLFF